MQAGFAGAGCAVWALPDVWVTREAERTIKVLNLHAQASVWVVVRLSRTVYPDCRFTLNHLIIIIY